MLAKTGKKNIGAWSPQICSRPLLPVTLHSAAAALKHLRFALRCWPFLTFIGQFRHFHARTIRAPHSPSFLESRHDITSPQFRPPSFQGKAFFRQTFAKNHPIFLPIDYRFTKCPRPWYHATNRSQCVSGCHGHPPLPAKHASRHRHWTLYTRMYACIQYT